MVPPGVIPARAVAEEAEAEEALPVAAGQEAVEDVKRYHVTNKINVLYNQI